MCVVLFFYVWVCVVKGVLFYGWRDGVCSECFYVVSVLLGRGEGCW